MISILHQVAGICAIPGGLNYRHGHISVLLQIGMVCLDGIKLVEPIPLISKMDSEFDACSADESAQLHFHL